MVLYGRRISVSVAGLAIPEDPAGIPPPRITVAMERQADETQTTGTVAIYNLSPGREAAIYERQAAQFRLRQATPIPSPASLTGRCNGYAIPARTWHALPSWNWAIWCATQDARRGQQPILRRPRYRPPTRYRLRGRYGANHRPA